MQKKEEEDILPVFTSDGQTNLAMIPLILGILAILGTLIVKVVGPRPVIGIENPPGTYGGYFLAGVGVGIVLAVIGMVMIALSSLGKEKKISELEEEFDYTSDVVFEEEEEIEEEGLCPTCGAVIPISSTECPECGEELEPYEEDEMEVKEVIVCPICGAEVEEDDEECPECGEPLAVEKKEKEDDIFSDI
ncbi:MAG: double zinc ribbon domain-containing protein [Thermoplasmatota archaeon]